MKNNKKLDDDFIEMSKLVYTSSWCGKWDLDEALTKVKEEFGLKEVYGE